MKMEKNLTLIGIKLAKKARKFLFNGAAEECLNCNSSLKTVCLDNLEKGRIYEITNVRKIVHPCLLHEGGVTVVEIKKASIQAAIDSKFAHEGATISFHFDCNEVSCGTYHSCKPLGIQSGEKYKITKIVGNLPQNCKKGKRIVLVELKP
jgi:uncharacterized protein (UPF0179 family)